MKPGELPPRVHWQDRIRDELEKFLAPHVEEISELEPEQPWAIKSMNNMEGSLARDYGLEGRSKEYSLGCLVGFLGRFGEDFQKASMHLSGKVTRKQEQMFANLFHAVAPEETLTIKALYKLFAEFGSESSATYRKCQQIAAFAQPSEVQDFTAGLQCAQSIQLLRRDMMPAFGTERTPLHTMLYLVGLSVQMLEMTEAVIDPEKFADLVGAAQGYPVTDVERIRKFLTDMKAPRRKRGRPRTPRAN